MWDEWEGVGGQEVGGQEVDTWWRRLIERELREVQKLGQRRGRSMRRQAWAKV